MKNSIYTIAIMVIALSSCGPTHVTVQNTAPAPQQPPNPESVSYQVFYDDLSPYGQWIDYPGYGYVWMPDAGPDFKPYVTNGQWVYSNEGWIWASDYEWGWATFHYGRWFFDQNYGWMWIPGNEWAPAWVNWRQSADYYGWAPLGPNISEGMYTSYNPPSNYWCFVPHQYVNSPRVNTYAITQENNITIINHTTIITNTVINNTIVNNHTSNHNFIIGPDANEVSRATGTTIRPIAVQTSSRAGQAQLSNGQLIIFRPKVNTGTTVNGSANNGQQKLAPQKVQSLSNLPRKPITNNNNNMHTAAPGNGSNATQLAAEPGKNNPPPVTQNEKSGNDLQSNKAGSLDQNKKPVTVSNASQPVPNLANKPPVNHNNTTNPQPSNTSTNSNNGNKKPAALTPQQNKANADTVRKKQNKPPAKPAPKPKPPATDKDKDKANPGQ
jgi:hypothetical protein